MIELVIPSLEDLWFRESLMADEETMSYNAAWGGTIPFPKEKWESWYEVWVRNPGRDHFYRYLKDAEKGFVGEAAWHFDSRRNLYICDVIVLAKYRHQGFGSEGINLLCKAAKENGISALYDDIAADNPSWKLFLKNGFEIDYRDADVVMVKREL